MIETKFSANLGLLLVKPLIRRFDYSLEARTTLCLATNVLTNEIYEVLLLLHPMGETTFSADFCATEAYMPSPWQQSIAATIAVPW